MPPSANWYGSALSALHSHEFAYCAQNAIVVVRIGLENPITILSGYSSRTTCVAFVEKDETVFLVSASQDRCIHVWKRQSTDTVYSRYRVLSKRPYEIRSISTDCNGSVVIGDTHGNVFVWDVGETGSKVQRVGESLKKAIVSVACCPCGTYQIVAVGCADGSVYLIDYGRQDGLVLSVGTIETEVQSVAWCEHKEGAFLLATSSKSGIICIKKVSMSRDADSGNVMIEHGAVVSFENSDSLARGMRRDQSPNRFWGACEWISIDDGFKKIYLLSSSYGGKIFVWDMDSLLRSDGLKELCPTFKLPENHSRAVFSVKAAKVGSMLYITSVGLDRICSVWTVPIPTNPLRTFEWKNAKVSQKYLGLGSHPNNIALAFEQNDNNTKPVYAAIGCGDGTIRISSCTLSGVKVRDDTLLWKHIPSPITVMSWYPESISMLCFGCTDGTVGVVNLQDKKIHLGTSRHKMPVGALSWVPDDAPATCYHLQSWCTAGVILTWPKIDDIMENNESTTKGPRDMEPDHSSTLEHDDKLMCMSAPFAGRLGTIILGYSSGLIEICLCQQAQGHAVLWSCCLVDQEDSHVLMITSTSAEHVIVLSDSGELQVFNNDNSNGSFCLAQCSLTDSFPNAVATSMNAYSYGKQHSEGYGLIVVGFDTGVIAVVLYQYDVVSNSSIGMKKVGVLQGHSAPVLQCQWAESNDAMIVLFTSSQDQSVRIWNLEVDHYISRFHEEPDEPSMTLVEPEESTHKDSKAKSRGKQRDSGSTSLTTLLPAVAPIAPEVEPIVIENLNILFSKRTHENITESLKDLANEWGILLDVPISSDVGESFMDAYSQKLQHSARTSKSDQISHRRNLAHRAAALKLWEGNVGGALRILLESDALTADFVCFAAGLGKDAWIAVSRVFADQLEKKGDVHLAALYLTQIGDIVDACLLYEKHKMLREAATLASRRLPSSHHVTLRCVESYAKQLARTGNHVKGSLVLAGLGQFDQAQRMLNSSAD